MTSKLFKSQQIRQFKFWLDQSLQDGMQYQHSLFQHASTWEYEQRNQLYQYARELARQGVDTLITYNASVCHLWINLKHKSLVTALLASASNSNDSPQASISAVSLSGQPLHFQCKEKL